MVNTEITTNTSGHKQIPVWKNASCLHITALMAACSLFYYMDVIVDYFSLVNLRWGIFYTVHDLHRALFLIPAMYAAYKFKLKGIVVTSFISLLIFLPRALAVSPYPNPLLRALIFIISMIIMGVFLSLLLNNITKRKDLEQSLHQAQSDLLRNHAESQRDEAFESLRENTALFAKISSQVPGMLYQFVRKPNGTYSVPFSNEGVKDIFGCSPEDVRDNFDPIFQAIFPEDRGRIIQTIEESAASLLPWKCEYRVQLPGKPVRWILGNSIPEKTADGTIVWSGYNTDITERKLAEKALRESEKLYRSLFDGMLNAFQYSKMIFDQGTPVDYIYLDVNRAFESLTGLKDVTGRKVSEVLPGILQSDPELFQILARVALNGNHEKFDIYVNALNQWFSASAYSPAKEYFVVIFEDITERKRAEEELRGLTESLNLALETARAGTWDWNVVSGDIEWSSQMFDLFGLDPSKNTASFAAWKSVLHPQDLEMAGSRINQALANHENLNSDYRVVLPDGAIRWINATGKGKYDERSQPIRMMGICVDITDRKLAEAKLALNSQRIQALLQLNQMTDSTLKEITDFALEEAVRLTQSKIGYLAFLNEDESILTMHSWSKSAMAQCAIDEKPILYPVATTGLWGEAVRQRKPVITNDYAAGNPLKKGYPQGHVALERHMNIPVFAGARIVLVAGVGNKAEDYDQSDVHELTLLMESMWRLIERKRVYEELRKLNEELEQRVAQRTAELLAKTAELERTNKVFVDRELRMRELKERIAELEKKA